MPRRELSTPIAIARGRYGRHRRDIIIDAEAILRPPRHRCFRDASISLRRAFRAGFFRRRFPETPRDALLPRHAIHGGRKCKPAATICQAC